PHTKTPAAAEAPARTPNTRTVADKEQLPPGNTLLLERRHNSPVTCCRRLRSAEVPSGRRPAGACGRWKGLCRGWERPERRTEERIGGVAVVEQLQPVHPSDARTWVEEHEPEDGVPLMRGGWPDCYLWCHLEGMETFGCKLIANEYVKKRQVTSARPEYKYSC
uniref:SCAN box domain-containing protein n=1 Tax=Oryzias latipes TaxID=8090 RepID=A0A3B3H2G5_ORYLA